MAVTALIIILVVPICSGKGTFVCTPIAFITVAGIFVKPLILSWDAASELELEAASIKVPDWINQCVDSNVVVDLSLLEDSRSDIESLVGSIRTLATLMTIFCFMVALITCLTATGLCCMAAKGVCGCDAERDIRRNMEGLPKEGF